MKLTIERLGELQFRFNYRRMNSAAPKKFTTAIVSIGEQKFAAYAELAPGDRFVKATGRRIALTRLLRLCSNPPKYAHANFVPPLFTRAERRQIWNAYFAMHADLKTK